MYKATLTDLHLDCKQFSLKEKVLFIIALIFGGIAHINACIIHSLEKINQNVINVVMPPSCLECQLRHLCKTTYGNKKCILKQKQRIIESMEKMEKADDKEVLKKDIFKGVE